MTLDFTRLGVLAEQPAEPEQVPLIAAMGTRTTTVLAFDQSLSSTGYVGVSRGPHGIGIWASRTLRPIGVPEGNSGFETDFARAASIEAQVEQVLLGEIGQRLIVAHEMPAVGSKRIPGAGISSKMAALAIRSAARHVGLIEAVRMVNSQQAKKYVCGNARADKKEAHAALRTQIMPHLPGSDQVTNEHERDALMVALAVLLKET